MGVIYTTAHHPLMYLPHELLDGPVPFPGLKLEDGVLSRLGCDGNISSTSVKYYAAIIPAGDLQPLTLRAKVGRSTLQCFWQW
jgi:hypothetical protein